MSVLRWEGDYVYGTWITFVRTGNSATGKTIIVDVVPCEDRGKGEGEAIGQVKWFGPWRQYAFFPLPDTVYEKTCLSEIAAFCRELMEDRKKVAKP